MTTTRKQDSAKFKARVAEEAIRGEKTLSQMGSEFKLHPVQIAKWRLRSGFDAGSETGLADAGLEEGRVQEDFQREGFGSQPESA